MVLRITDELGADAKLIIADICCKPDVLQQVMKVLKEKKAVLRIYDHHITQEWLRNISVPDGLDFGVEFQLDKCASKMIYDAHVETYPELKRYADFSDIVNDRDLWINENKHGALLTKLHNIYDDEMFIERMAKSPSLELSEREKILLEYQGRKEEKYLVFLLETIKIMTDANGFRYGVLYGNGTSPELLDRALREKDLEYAMLVNLNAKRASIRSKGKFDCAEFALERGGGGHKCAAGFPVEFDFPVI
ncbi:hypothetical protein ACFL5V_02800 [Fibrobacterota bacterium]